MKIHNLTLSKNKNKKKVYETDQRNWKKEKWKEKTHIKIYFMTVIKFILDSISSNADAKQRKHQRGSGWLK